MHNHLMTAHAMVTLPGEQFTKIREPFVNVSKKLEKRNIQADNFHKSPAVKLTDTHYLEKLLFMNDRKKTKHKMSAIDHTLLKKFQKVLHEIDRSHRIDKHMKSVHRKRAPKALVNSFWKYPKVKQSVNAEEVYYKGDNHNSTNDTVDVSQESAYTTDCLHPEYLVYTWVLSLIALATTLKLYFLIKTLLAVTMVAVYTLFILVFFPEVFNVHSHR